ncbi:MAG: hypothetical protein QXR27_01155 [Archaeoglobaceae archaeon]
MNRKNDLNMRNLDVIHVHTSYDKPFFISGNEFTILSLLQLFTIHELLEVGG